METIEQLKTDFLYNVAKYAEGLKDGSGKKVNRFQKKIINIHKRSIELKCDNLFITFLDSKDEYVKYWAAILCEEKYPNIVKNAYRDLQKSSEPIISLSAREYLKHH